METLTSYPQSVLDWSLRWQKLSQADSRTSPEAEDSRRECAPPDDSTWIARVRQGDEDAACALAHRLYPTIMRVVRGRLPQRTSAEDLAQVVFARIFSRLGQFSGLAPLEHWVARIAVNTCINHLKHEIRRPELRMSDLSEEAESVIQHFASTDNELPGEGGPAARELLERMLARLKPDERLVIRLLHLEERNPNEISQMTGWSVSLVKVKAFRARHKMRKRWKALVKAQQW